MRIVLLALLALSMAAVAEPIGQLSDFTLTDQAAKTRSYRFPKARVSVLTVADHKGSDQLAPWIQRLYDRYQKRIDIDGVADVSMIPKPFHNMLRDAFRKRLTYSVMLDWEGAVVRQLGYQKGVANIYVIDRSGRIVTRRSGPATDAAMRDLAVTIDRAITAKPTKQTD